MIKYIPQNSFGFHLMVSVLIHAGMLAWLGSFSDYLPVLITPDRGRSSIQLHGVLDIRLSDMVFDEEAPAITVTNLSATDASSPQARDLVGDISAFIPEISDHLAAPEIPVSRPLPDEKTAHAVAAISPDSVRVPVVEPPRPEPRKRERMDHVLTDREPLLDERLTAPAATTVPLEPLPPSSEPLQSEHSQVEPSTSPQPTRQEPTAERLKSEPANSEPPKTEPSKTGQQSESQATPSPKPETEPPAASRAAASSPTSQASEGADADALPHALTNPAPQYPAAALKAGLQGRVLLSVNVGADGAVIAARVYRSSGVPSLDAAALEAVRRWHFHPARRAGLAVPKEVAVPVRFVIQKH